MIKCEQLNYLKKDIISNYKMFHQIPELGFEEFETSKNIIRILEEYGVDEIYTNVADTTGVICTINGELDGKTVLLRADMDALALQETTGVDFKSKRDGFMHACGHDGHVSMLLGAVKFFSENRDLIKGRIKFVFQPAEEGPGDGGAIHMIKSSLLKDVDAAFGIHLNTQKPTGYVAIPKKECTASCDSFYLKVTGKGGHGSAPHMAVDPILISANIISAYNNIVSREIDPKSTAVISFGTISGGQGPTNVIPNEVNLNGTIRTFDEEVREFIVERMEEIAINTAKASRGKAEFIREKLYYPTINDKAMANLVKKSLDPILGSDNVELGDLPNTGGEDFGRYLREVPGAFYWVGAGNEEKGCTYMMHNPNMKVDLESLLIGTTCHINVALNYLNL